MAGALVLRCILVAAVLWGGLPAWKHAHVDGHLPHRVADHAAHHDGLGEQHSHWHITLWGIEFTLPAAPDSEDTADGQLAFLVAEPAVAPSGIYVAALGMLVQTPHVDAGPRPIVDDFRAKPSHASLLCDTARHERSGVLLA